MSKRIETEVNSCSGCPYCSYNSSYGMSYDSGYDCKLGGFRIIDDYDYDNSNNENNMCKDGYVPIPIPDSCPLPDK